MSSMPSIKTRDIRIVQNVPISKTLKFWEGLKHGKIYATVCVKCGKLNFPPTADCPHCHSSKMQWRELSTNVVIETFTHVMIRPATFKHNKPYIVAIGKLKEGVRVLAWMTGFKFSDVKIGMKAKLIAKATPEGNPTYEFVRDSASKL